MIAMPTIAQCRISRILPVRWSAREGDRSRMETGLHNQSTKLVGQKIFAARNRAPIILTELILRITHLNLRSILVEVTTKSIINHESLVGLAKSQPKFSALE
jgi:hypothetical protein